MVKARIEDIDRLEHHVEIATGKLQKYVADAVRQHEEKGLDYLHCSRWLQASAIECVSSKCVSSNG